MIHKKSKSGNKCFGRGSWWAIPTHLIETPFPRVYWFLLLGGFSKLTKDDIMKVAAKEHAKDLNSATICEKSVCFVLTHLFSFADKWFQSTLEHKPRACHKPFCFWHLGMHNSWFCCSDLNLKYIYTKGRCRMKMWMTPSKMQVQRWSLSSGAAMSRDSSGWPSWTPSSTCLAWRSLLLNWGKLMKRH